MWKAFVLVLAGVSPVAASAFAGRVVEDHSGNPVPRAEIRITRSPSSAILAELETDGEGRFRTPDLPDSEYVLRFSKTDYSPVELSAHARSDMFLRLTRFGAIAGKISNAEGHPVSSAQVVALTPSGATAGTPDRNAGPGEYRIYDLPPGAYQVAILTSSEGRSLHGLLLYPNNSGPRQFEVSGGEDYTGADFILPGGLAFQISAKADSTQAKSVGFELVSAEYPARQLAQQLVPVDRPFTVENVLPGNYELLVSAVSSGSPSVFGRIPITVVAANLGDIHVPVDQTRSAAFTLRTAEPCAADAVIELKAREAWLPNRPVSLPIQAGKPASLSSLAPARYSITAKASRGNCYATVQNDLDLTRESASRPIEVALVPPGSLEGRLTGSPQLGGYVIVLKSRDRSLQRIAFPDEKGAFSISDLPPGSYSVLAAAPNTRWGGDRGGSPVEITGAGPTALELKVSEVSR